MTSKLYGGFMMVGHYFSPAEDEKSQLVYLSNDEKKAKEFMKDFAELHFRKLNFIHGYRKHIRLAYLVVPLSLDEKIKPPAWNDAKDYLEYYYSVEEVDYKLKHGIKLNDTIEEIIASKNGTIDIKKHPELATLPGALN